MFCIWNDGYLIWEFKVWTKQKMMAVFRTALCWIGKQITANALTSENDVVIENDLKMETCS